MDGSNAQLTNELVAARNGISANHISFSMLKSMHCSLKDNIPEGIQVFGEWLYAKHSIEYTDEISLDSFFQIFSVYDQEKQIFSSWEDVENMAETLGVPTVPILEKGKCYKYAWELEARICELANDVISIGHEGLVIRSMYPFPYGSFEGYNITSDKITWTIAPIAKFVRSDHIQTDANWSRQPINRNKLKS